MDMYADIIINRKASAVDRLFSYRVPAHLQEQMQPGMLVMVPFNREKLEGVVVQVYAQAPEVDFELKEIVQICHDRPLFSRELLDLSEWISEYYLCSRAAALQAMLPAGMSLTGRPARIFFRDYYALAEDISGLRITAKRKQLAELLSLHKEMSREDLLQAGFSGDFLRSCVQAGLLNMSRRRVVEGSEPAAVTASELSEQQQLVLQQIIDDHEEKRRPFLLHGVTGSGKTELYLRLIERCHAQGKQSIVLVPEIALSTQMVEMLTQRLQLSIAVMHSGLKQAERRQIWQDIAEGRISCVVGARSAVFAPVPAPGLIIVDEAHETSYKQDHTPRFSALTVAEKRAELSGAMLVLGSATPSVEQAYWAVQGNYAYGALRQHYHTAPLPQVRIVDMRDELRAGNKSIFSRQLIEALKDTLDNGEQAVLFMNRRGYYQHFSCRDCGQSITCPHCAVAMSFHADHGAGRLKCHYCGRSMLPPQICPTCGSRHIRRFGVGTQRIADELAALFPAARIARLDSDVLEKQGAHEQVYRAMRSGEADILVGTQMVAKGLDFPKLTLAAVVVADTILNLPDWRAGERTYQLITQLIGRAGRRDKQGLALIQTYTPTAPPISAAAEGNYRAFYEYELKYRYWHGYPPFTSLIRVVMSATDRRELLRLSNAYAHYLKELLSAEDELCGPADAPLSKVKDRYRRHILIKCKDLSLARAAVEQAGLLLESKEHLCKGFLLTIDVDPFGVM